MGGNLRWVAIHPTALTGAEGKQLKTQINTQWIYPPAAVRETALAAADPLIPVVA